MEGPKFLKQKLPDLHSSKEVDRAVKNHVRSKKEKVSNNAEEKIEIYLKRLEDLVLDKDQNQEKIDFENSRRPRALLLIREKVMEKYVRDSLDKKTEGAIRVEERAARELGMGDLHYGEEQVNQRQEVLQVDVEKSLDAWISYLSDNNEPYPTWFRYYVFRNVLNMGDFDKDKKEFKKRSIGSAGLFPDIDRGALAYMEDMISASKDEFKLKKLQEAQKSAANNDLKPEEILTKEKVKQFAEMSFPKQYLEAMKQNGEITPEMRKETRGKWIKYQQGTDPTALWSSLQNKGTAWCTKGFGTASTQLNSGDFYVYYTLDKKGEPAIPRIAIRMNGQNKIGEVRGVEDNKQNVEGNMIPILEEKLKDFGPEADYYEKRSSDMKRLTDIDNRLQKDSNLELSKEELKFIYQVDCKIEGFGYAEDPRIKEIIKKRNFKEDFGIILELDPKNIITNIDDINENTKAFVKEDGEKIQIADFRNDKRQLDEAVRLIKLAKENNCIARPDLFFEGKVFHNLEIEPLTKSEALKKYKDSGGSTWIWDELEKNMPYTPPSRKSLNVNILSFSRDISSEDAIKEMDKLNVRPLTYEELIQFGITYPEFQKQNPLIALGSKQVLSGLLQVPKLDGGSARGLDANDWIDDWIGNFRFPVVSK